jgi:hypothetical protein
VHLPLHELNGAQRSRAGIGAGTEASERARAAA